MTERRNRDRQRVRAARYEAGSGFDQAVERALNRLPKKTRASIIKKRAVDSSIAAALVLFLAFAAPPIVRAAGELYQRLFRDVVRDLTGEQALSAEERLEKEIAEVKRASRNNALTGATADVGGVTVTVAFIRLMPDNMYDDNSPGEVDLRLTYSAIPSFDPSRVDFALVVDGIEVPMVVDEELKDFRDAGKRTLTEAEWSDECSTGNSEIVNGVPTTNLSFAVNDWKWETGKPLELKATIDGQTLAIPFAFSAEQAHEYAVAKAREYLSGNADAEAREVGEMADIEASAVPVGLTGDDYGHAWAISEMSYLEGQLYFTASFGGIENTNIKVVGQSYWVDASVDGMFSGSGGSKNDALSDGTYTAIYFMPLGRDPANLPEESVIRLTFELGEYENRKTVAFKYNWKEKKVTLPSDEREMEGWAQDALSSRYPDEIGLDLKPLNLTAEADSIKMTITGVRYFARRSQLAFYASYDGDASASKYNWMGIPVVTISGVKCEEEGGGVTGEVHTEFYVCPPMHISEFGDGDEVVFQLPLYAKDGGDAPATTLEFKFTIDKTQLSPLAEN